MECEWKLRAGDGVGTGGQDGRGALRGALSEWRPVLVLPARMLMAAQELRSLFSACADEPW